MKKLTYLFLLVFIFQSCSNKTVKLPTNTINGIQDTIYNNSKIWLFFNENNGDTIAQLNKNNKITNTHYIFNIDKRLQLKHLIKVVNKIQFKKEQPSMHSNGKYMHSYLSYVNTKSNKLSMVLFDSVKFYPLKDLKATKHQILLKYTNSEIQLNQQKIAFNDLQTELKKYKDSSKRKLNLILNNDVTYENYLKLKANLQQLKLDSIFINKQEYIK